MKYNRKKPALTKSIKQINPNKKKNNSFKTKVPSTSIPSESISGSIERKPKVGVDEKKPELAKSIETQTTDQVKETKKYNIKKIVGVAAAWLAGVASVVSLGAGILMGAGTAGVTLAAGVLVGVWVSGVALVVSVLGAVLAAGFLVGSMIGKTATIAIGAGLVIGTAVNVFVNKKKKQE